MNSTKIEPKFISKSNPRVGLIALASDFMIERDFINVIKDRDIDFFVNRIECYNPLTKENLIKMSNKVTEVTKDILPHQDIDCIVYGCTSGTIAAGYNSIEQKVKAAKPKADVTTPSTAAIKALKKLNIKKICLFTPYSKKLNDEVLDYFKSEGFEITSNPSFLKYSKTSSLSFLLYGVNRHILFIFNFFKALIAAVLGVVTSAIGFAALTFFSIDS